MATAEKIVHVSEFTNEPFIDFTKPENRTRMQEALKKVKAEFGREYPMWLNGKKVTTTEKRTSTNPSHPMEISVFSRMPRRRWRGRPSKTPTDTLTRGKKFRRRRGQSLFFERRRSCAKGNMN